MRSQIVNAKYSSVILRMKVRVAIASSCEHVIARSIRSIMSILYAGFALDAFETVLRGW
jgi:hypothetical protein